MPKSRKSDFRYQISAKGFTLVELLITVAIIGVLLAIAIASYQKLISGARDAQRQSDLKVIQSALEQYKADQGFYPSSNSSASNLILNTTASLTNSVGNPAVSTPTRTYLSKIPTEPQGAWSDYLYKALPETFPYCDNSVAGRCTGYCIFARLEDATNVASAPGCTLMEYYNYSVAAP